MTSAFERRMLRACATTNDAMSRSELVIWCYEPENMPAMIDLLIAQGRLTEADRPHCVHYSTLGEPFTREHYVKAVDADEMLNAAGIRTLIQDGTAALFHSAEAVDAFLRERCAGLDPAEIGGIRKLGERLREQQRRWEAVSHYASP